MQKKLCTKDTMSSSGASITSVPAVHLLVFKLWIIGTSKSGVKIACHMIGDALSLSSTFSFYSNNDYIHWE